MMKSRTDLAVAMMRSAHRMLHENASGVTIVESLQTAGGFRSILGILKHTAAWAHIYHSYAFDAAPKHWRAIDWPRGLRDTIDPSEDYLREVVAWFESANERWIASLSREPDDALDQLRPCHWGATAPLFDILLMVTNHWCYHAGEINQILSTLRGEAWEYSEEVEENHISTAGHRVRPGWMNDQQATAYEAYLNARDAQLRPSGNKT